MYNTYWVGVHGCDYIYIDNQYIPPLEFEGLIEVLSKYGLKLEKKLLSAFLSRCSVKPQRDGIPYREFLHRFQDRSEGGMTHSILNSKKHRLVRLCYFLKM
jgi:hypothetical protein